VEAHPNLDFVAIVNPNSGPGDSDFPDNNYDPQIRKLNSYLNVKTIGYVRTGYGTRNISTVISEVNTYAGWYSKSPELAMHGIFFDESPHEYVAESVPYMKTVNEVVKNNTAGLQGTKTVGYLDWKINAC
jgi:Spherulation-specific family 4